MQFFKQLETQHEMKLLLNLDIQFFAGDEPTELKTLQKEFSDSWKNLKGLLDQQADEMRNFGETNQKTADSIKTLESKIEGYEKELKGVTEKFKTVEAKFNRPDFLGNGSNLKTTGSLFVESDSYKNMGENRHAAMQVKSFYRKELGSAAADGGVFVGTQRIGGVFGNEDGRNLRLRDLLNVQPTQSNSLDYIVETGFTNAAAIAPEKSLKPQSDLTFDLESASVKTIAHWIPASRQIIDDAPMLRSYVDNRLLYGLALTEEAQILYGDGIGDNMQGIMTNAAIQNAGGIVGQDSFVDHIRRAITRTTLAGYPATGIVLHPSNWEEIELLKGSDGHYVWVNVVSGGEPRLWKVPVVESTEINEGEFLVGAFGLGAQLWDREQANVRVSEHHADYFARNMLAILAEERLALTTYRPEAFVRGAFTAQA